MPTHTTTAAAEAAAEAPRGWIDYGGCLRWNAGDPAAEGATCSGCGRAPTARCGTAEAPPHPRAQFDPYGTAPPAEPWGYDVDDTGVAYTRGTWWPYADPFVRLAPDTAYYAWRNHYVLAGREDGDPESVRALLHLHVAPQGMGAIVVDVAAVVHLPTGRVTLSPADLDGELLAQAQDRARRVGEFINAERLRATSPPYPPGPVTAHEKYAAAETTTT